MAATEASTTATTADATTAFPAAALAAAGLNRHAIFQRSDLPADLLAQLPDGDWQELVLLAHAGPLLWQRVSAAQQAGTVGGDDPIDAYTVDCIKRLFSNRLRKILYPGPQAPGLQALGQLAGWHRATPFMVGIDPEYGTWFAYRALLLTAGGFLPTPPVDREHPCTDCCERPCLAACPAGALAGGELDLASCLDYRLQAGSRCAATCHARAACPVGGEYRYSPAQIAHAYGHSLRFLRAWRQETAATQDVAAGNQRDKTR